MAAVTGRFAPSPTGPLHLGSLVAAVGSWLSARAAGGRWLVRIEDLDTPRVVPGSAEEIVEALKRYGLEPDEEPVWQSRRSELYAGALRTLRDRGLVFECGCSRAEVQRAASAPVGQEPVYPGTCRNGLPDGRIARATRFRSSDDVIVIHDAVQGELAEKAGDFVIKRADGPFAYQLAVVVDDAEQSVTEVVRGADLLNSTPKQVALQRALGLPAPRYVHLPLVVGVDGSKLGKRDGALPLPTLDEGRVRQTLSTALRILGLEVAPGPHMLEEALARFDVARIPRAHTAV
jgi:glutamyl-Q tRNA(Asp) synthetase